MSVLDKYIRLCRKFHPYRIPKIKFKELEKRQEHIYRNEYDINENDINKASFFVFSITFSTLVSISLLMFNIDMLMVLIFSLILSLVISYRFNLTLYKIIKKREYQIDAFLYLIKINFSLIQKSLNSNSDYCLNFIILLKNYNFPLSEKFKDILKKIHEGYPPENELNEMITPSKEFNIYLKNQIANDFNYSRDFELLEQGSLEEKFKIYLRDIESKISIIFFIGLFFPIGLCFIILFQQFKPILMILFIPFFLICLKYLFKKYVKIDYLLIGLLKDFSKIEKKKFDEFLLFLKGFAVSLEKKFSPEKAFFMSFYKNRNKIILLKKPIQTQLTLLINSSNSFKQSLNSLKLELNSIRYSLILDTIEKLIEKNSYYSHKKILDILGIITKHRNLEKKLDIIINGEKFKVFFFLFLLPIVIGAVSGLLPFFKLITNDLDFNSDIFLNSYHNAINYYEIAIIFLTLLSCNIITSYYFLKIVNHDKPLILIFMTSTIFTLSFYISFLNIVAL